MDTSHPLTTQLEFTRYEFIRAVKNVSDNDARRRILPMNCISWNIGHLAWQVQRYFLYFAQGILPFPDIDRDFAYGAPASTPPIKEMLAVWKSVTEAANPWLAGLTSEILLKNVVSNGKPIAYTFGNLLQRVIYHYWYHTGENMAIRQMLGHDRLPVFVGNIDSKAPYRPEVNS